MFNNYNGYYYPYNNIRNIPNMSYARTIPNPYYGTIAPSTRSAGGLLSRLIPGLGGASSVTTGAATGGITFSGILSGASKTLGVINQAIPVFYQMKPIWNNAKTMFRVAKAMNSNDQSKTTSTKETTNTNSSTNNEPTFFK